MVVENGSAAAKLRVQNNMAVHMKLVHNKLMMINPLLKLKQK